ncbi:MAG: NAD(P)H-dependent oxidoreductase [Bacteroidales bacterium]|jgi:multimeric flavodoxin WrbA|nr:NAD(P)H-dependent oxidoreductase [Bacteroidales bacterium]
MNRRNFLKAAGIAGATLLVRELAGAGIKHAQKRKEKKVIALNGSPHEKGNTAYALSVMEEVFRKEHIEFEVIPVGIYSIRGCIACGRCRETGEECIFTNDREREWLSRMKLADAFVFASPSFFGGIPGTMKSFLDRAFYAQSRYFQHKLGAAIVTTQRSGASMTFESLNQYFTINQMNIVSSSYWNNIRGSQIDDLKQDEEGIRTLETLAKNMINKLKIENGASGDY